MDEQNRNEQTSEYIIGRNSVREALKSENQQIDCIYVVQGARDGSINELKTMAREKHVTVKEIPRYKIDSMCAELMEGGRPVNHQGVLCQVPAYEYAEIEDIFSLAERKGEPPCIVILDGIQDPQNLGSIIRSAEALGAHGVIIGKRRSASLSLAAYKVASGAAQYIPVVKVTNINSAIEEIKKKNVFVAAADMEGQPVYKANLKGALGIVIGGEHLGVSRLTRDLCDMTVSIDMKGQTGSLNAACAAGIVIYEKMRQDAVSN